MLTKHGMLKLETYGKATRLNKELITGSYVVLAIAIPIVVPVFLAPLIYKYCPQWIRY